MMLCNYIIHSIYYEFLLDWITQDEQYNPAGQNLSVLKKILHFAVALLCQIFQGLLLFFVSPLYYAFPTNSTIFTFSKRSGNSAFQIQMLEIYNPSPNLSSTDFNNVF